MSPAVSVQHAGTVECAASLRARVTCVLKQALTFTRPTGRVQWEGDEKCDDGNTQENDGCDKTCKVESSWLCVCPRDSKFIGIPRKSYMERDSFIRIGSQLIPYGQAEWPGGPRFGSGSVVFKGALRLLGGSGSAYTRQFSTTLSESSNGDLCVAPEPEDSCANGPTDAAGKPLSFVSGKTSLDWRVASPDASTPWQARCFMGVLAYKDRLYVIGGARSKCQKDYTAAVVN
jgi:cysteine-rich repeat protein